MQSSLPYTPGGIAGWIQRQLPMHERPYLQGMVLLLIYAVAFIPAFTFFSGSSLRFITYLVPIVNLFIWFMLSPRQLQYDTRYVIALGMYAALLIFTGIFVVDTFDSYTWINALRPIFYLLMFVPFMLFNLNSLRVLVVIIAITMILQSLLGTATTAGDFSIAESKGLLESGLAFPLGALLIFCLYYKRKFTSVIVFMLFLAAFKRIAIVSVAMILIFMGINWILSRLLGIRESYLAMGTALLLLAASVLLNLFYYEFFVLLADLMGLEQSVLTLTMGRLDEFYILDMQTGSQPIMNVLFGGGPGSATRNLVEVTITYPLQVHNSYLLYYYDFGVVGFTWFMLGFLIIYSRNAFGLYLFAYNAFVMVTDNSYTHHYHQFICFVLIAIAQYLDEQRKLPHATVSSRGGGQ